MQKIFYSILAIFFIVSTAAAGDGLISVKSSHVEKALSNFAKAATMP